MLVLLIIGLLNEIFLFKDRWETSSWSYTSQRIYYETKTFFGGFLDAISIMYMLSLCFLPFGPIVCVLLISNLLIHHIRKAIIDQNISPALPTFYNRADTIAILLLGGFTILNYISEEPINLWHLIKSIV